MHSIHLNVYRLQRNNTYINKYNIDLLIQRMENRRIDSLGSSFKYIYIYKRPKLPYPRLFFFCFFFLKNIKRQVAYQGLLGLEILPRLMTELLLL